MELDLRGLPCSRGSKRLPLYFEGDEREALGFSSCFNREEVTIRGRRLLISFRSFPRGEIIIERVIGQQTSLIPANLAEAGQMELFSKILRLASKLERTFFTFFFFFFFLIFSQITFRVYKRFEEFCLTISHQYYCVSNIFPRDFIRKTRNIGLRIKNSKSQNSSTLFFGVVINTSL